MTELAMTGCEADNVTKTPPPVPLFAEFPETRVFTINGEALLQYMPPPSANEPAGALDMFPTMMLLTIVGDEYLM